MLPKLKGMIGELKVRFALWRHLRHSTKTLHNATLLTASGNTTQIDHIVICRAGIFVIETKNYSGYISTATNQKGWLTCPIEERTRGSELTVKADTSWYQSRDKVGKAYPIYNPIEQNRRHVAAVRNCLGADNDYPVHNMVCLVGDATMINRVPTEVVLGATSLVNEIAKKNAVAGLSANDIDAAYQKIKIACLPKNKKTKLVHEQYVEKVKANKLEAKRKLLD